MIITAFHIDLFQPRRQWIHHDIHIAPNVILQHEPGGLVIIHGIRTQTERGVAATFEFGTHGTSVRDFLTGLVHGQTSRKECRRTVSSISRHATGVRKQIKIIIGQERLKERCRKFPALGIFQNGSRQ